MKNPIENLKYGDSANFESEEKFRVLFEMSPLPIFLETLHGRIIDCNSAAVKMTGYSAKELLKMTAADLVPKKVAKIFPKLIEEEIKKGVFQVRAENRRKNGEIFPVEANGRVVTIEGRKYVFVTVRDITEEQSELTKIRESEEGFRMLFNGITDGILVADVKTGKFFLSNPAMEKLLGMKGAEIEKLSVADIHPAGEVKKIQTRFKAMARGKISITENLPIIRKDKSLFYADVSAYLIDLHGKEYVVGLFRDVTEKKQAAELKRLEAEKLTIINQVITAAGRAQNLDELLKDSLDIVLRVMGFDGGGVYLLDKEGDTASVVYSINLPRRFLRQVSKISIKQQPYKKIFVNGEPLITEEYEKVAPERARYSGFKSLISLPLISGDKVIGALNIASRQNALIPERVKETIISVGKEIGGAIKRMQIEEDLVRHEARYRTIIEHSLDIIFTFDKHGKIVFVTPNVSNFGYTIKGMIGTSFANYVHPDDVKRLKRELRRVVRTRKVFITEFRIVSKDGQIFYVEEYGTPIFDAKGKFILFTGALRDISERKKLSEEAKNYTERLKVMFEDAPDAYYLSNLKGILIDGNKAAEALTGYKRKDLIGRSFVSLKDFIVPGQQIKIARLIARNVRGESTGPDEFQLRRKDGKIIYVEVSTHPVKIEGKPLVLGIARDITEHIQTEAELKSKMLDLENARKELSASLEEVQKAKIISESLAHDLEKYEMAVKSASDHIVITDTDAKIIFANRAAERVTGYTVDEMIGKDPGALWGGQMSKDFFKKMWDTIKKDKKVYVGELTNKRKSGELYDAEVNIAPILDKNKNIVFFVGIERDITRAKEMDKMKTEFVTIASHQLRTPLTSLKWYAELLVGAEKELSRKNFDYVRRIYDSSHKMVRLVNDLLNVSRIEAGRKFLIEKKISNITALVKRAVSDQSVTEFQNKVSIEMRKWPEKLNMTVDEEKIYQVFQNLINNAVMYSRPGGKVEVLVEQKKDSCVFAVQDHGIGIPLKQHERVFDKFFRGDNVKEAGKSGTGLGLYIVKAIVEGHGGQVWFDSKENKGTTFYFEIPKK